MKKHEMDYKMHRISIFLRQKSPLPGNIIEFAVCTKT